MKEYSVKIPEDLYKEILYLCKQKYSEVSSETINEIIKEVIKEGITILKRKILLENLVPKEEKYDIEAMIDEIKNYRENDSK